MNVKIDTKEKFTVITPEGPLLSANMTEEMDHLLLPYLQKDIQHIVYNMSLITDIEEAAAEKLEAIQQLFYENNCSFLICALNKKVETIFDQLELLEVLNVTPTETEAWDIVQMEEIERELPGDDETTA